MSRAATESLCRGPGLFCCESVQSRCRTATQRVPAPSSWVPIVASMRRIIAPTVLALGLVLAGCGSTSYDAGGAPAPENHAAPEGADGSAAQDAERGESQADRHVIATGDMRVIIGQPRGGRRRHRPARRVAGRLCGDP